MSSTPAETAAAAAFAALLPADVSGFTGLTEATLWAKVPSEVWVAVTTGMGEPGLAKSSQANVRPLSSPDLPSQAWPSLALPGQAWLGLSRHGQDWPG